MDAKQRKQSLNYNKIKFHNQKRILDLIQASDGISRADIAKKLNLSKPAVSSNVSELLLSRIIFEDGTIDSSGGRRPIMVKFNGRYGTYISIILKPTKLKIVYFNIKGEIVFKNTMHMNLQNERPERILENLKDSIQTDLSRLNLNNIICIIISFPGIIKDNKIVVSNSMPSYNSVDVSGFFEGIFQCKTLLINDMNVKVLGMHEKFSYANYKNIVYLSHEANGIGAGLLINGRIYEGSQSSAGEVGLMYNITKLLPSENLISSLSSFEEILLKIGTDDLRDETALKCLAQYYSVIINNISVLIDPDIVILGGLLCEMDKRFLELLQDYISQISIIKINVILSNFDNDAEVQGMKVLAGQYINKKIMEIIY